MNARESSARTPETGDGAAIDIIYTGNRWTEPRIDGAFEGQRTLLRYGFARRRLIGLAIVLVIGFAFFMFAPEIPLGGTSRRS